TSIFNEHVFPFSCNRVLAAAMNITIICFSQTGNTQKVADTISTTLQECRHNVSIIPLIKARPVDALHCDVLGLGAPCFGSHVPTPIKRFLQSLPQLDGKRAFVFSTSAGASGKVLFDMTRLLRRKKAFVMGGINVRGQDNFPARSVKGRFPSRPDAEDLVKVNKFAQSLSLNMASHSPRCKVHGDRRALQRGFGYFDLMGAMVTGHLFRLITPRMKLDPNKCNECAWCERNCPMNNIIMAPQATIGKDCIRCYYCYRGCPQEALSADFRFTDLLISITYNSIFMRWFGDVSANEEIR
ncbi:MAG: EFR1 family ferrodoxin, partial [Syntrophales bacterium LBB04]|nr:EFR1 family ferrodoxin [Syntrophales bacterium LBB04]